MELQEMRDIALEVMQGAEDVYDKDAVLSEMFARNVPFNKLQSLYREVGKESGLVTDVAELKEKINDAIGNNAVTSFENFDAVLDHAAVVKEEVGTAPDNLVLSCIRAYYKEQEVVMPRKSRPFAPRGSVGSAVAGAAIDYAFNTPASDIERQGLYDALLPHCKSEAAAYNKTNSIFPMVFGIANRIDFEDTKEKIKELPLLAKAE